MFNQLHSSVLDFAENYRLKHPGFTYALRKANRKNRLEDGLWFQGTERYVFMGLINRSGGTNMTKSLGLVFRPNDDDVRCDLEIVHNEEKDKTILKFYKTLIQQEGDFRKQKETKYIKFITSTKGFAAAEEFLNGFLPKLHSLIKDLSLERILISHDEFDESLAKIKEYKNEADNTNNYWVFQGNPKVFDFEGAIKSGTLKSWTVTAHRDKIKPGDKIILWITGPKAGCYALAEITSLPYERKSSPDDAFYKTESKGDLQVDITIIKDLHENPIMWEDLKKNENLKAIKVGNQGTNFIATKGEYEALLKMSSGSREDLAHYWIYAPGKNADKWDEFYSKGEIGLGWERLGDLTRYKSKDEIENELKKLLNVTESKKNAATACFEFCFVMKPGDVVLVKKGRTELLGYGIIDSDYFFDENEPSLNNRRKVIWKKKGSWSIAYDLPLKTLTDITRYGTEHPGYDKYYDRLLGEMGVNLRQQSTFLSSSSWIAPLNVILYGPPGTGKTYNSILRAAEIIENRKIDRYSEAKEIFNKNLHDRIEFITFHQNYSYEDFIQGLRPEVDNNASLAFKKVDGIFKVMADRAMENLVLSAKDPDELSKDQLFDIALEKFIDEVQEAESNYKINDATFIMEVEEDAFRYSGENWARHAGGIRMKFNDLKEFYRNNVTSRKVIKDLKTVSALAKQHATYYFLVYQKILKHLPKKIDQASKIERKNYVLVIDEINRANISRVFGELITLIEPDKRSHGEIPLQAKLPSGDLFIVPSNLYIIGTMNTADKSIALLDIALRRRFEFESMYPKYEIDGYEIYDIDILTKLNEQIVKTKGHDFQIGHAYFMGENKKLVSRMNNKVIPLLMEYYMNDKESVVSILTKAGLEIDTESWPVRITGRRG